MIKMKKDKGLKIRSTIKEHVINNKKPYILTTLLFVIGIFLGVLFINNMQEGQKGEISSYLNQFIENFKNIEKLDQTALLQTSLKQNMILAIVIWFFGTTVIGLPIVFGMVLYRGFCLGYTISLCTYVLGMSKGMIFTSISLILPNLLFIPALLALAVSGFKLYQSIVKDKRKENIKIEIIRHTIFSLVMLVILAISSLVEILIATNILKQIIIYF